VRTRVRTPEGWLDFQDYFVRRRCAPEVLELAYDGAARARPHPTFTAALSDARLRAVVICPSNPYLSVDPILALPGVRDALKNCSAPVIAVSPIIGGRAVKGPTAKMMRELGLPVTAAAVAQHYAGLLDLFVVDHSEGEISLPNMRVAKASILMSTLVDREALAKAVLEFAAEFRAEPRA